MGGWPPRHPLPAPTFQTPRGTVGVQHKPQFAQATHRAPMYRVGSERPALRAGPAEDSSLRRAGQLLPAQVSPEIKSLIVGRLEDRAEAGVPISTGQNQGLGGERPTWGLAASSLWGPERKQGLPKGKVEWPLPSNSVSPLSLGSEGLQEAGAVCVLGGAHPWGLCHQPHLHLGGPSGPQHLPALGAAQPPRQQRLETARG